MADRSFTELEAQVIKHYFTIENIEVLENDNNVRVYCRRDTLPMSIWPFLIGGYSRSAEPLAVRWLLAIREADPENYEKNLNDLVSDSGTDRSEAISNVIRRVEKFLSTWAVNYGHSSLKDSALDCFAIECLSQRATKEVEDADLAAFQEKSTRYMDFSKPNFYTCDHPGIASLYQSSMALYENVLAYAISFYQEQYKERTDFASERAKENTIKAKAFDVARYCLPAGIRTSLGITMSTRATERMIQRLLASTLSEGREIGAQMLEHGVKINPGLLKHVKRNDYLVRKARVQPNVLQNHIPTTASVNQVTLIGLDRETLISTLVTALAYRSSNSASEVFAFCQDANNREERDYLFKSMLQAALEDRGPHDEFPVEFKHGSLMFDITLDMGAFRDLQRHRVGTQLLSEYSPFNGYAVPDVIAKNEQLLKQYHDVMQSYILLAGLFSNKECVEYCMALAHNVRYVYTCDVKQLAYILELRTGPAGHWSYRQVCQEMAKQFLALMPEFTPYIRVNWDVETDRSQSENQTEAKIAALIP